MSETPKKVVICGATGFIGRNLTEALAGRSDMEVHAVWHSRPPFECPGVVWHQADLRESHSLASLFDGADIIIQAAATTSGIKDITFRPHIHVTDNAVMNSLILRAAYDCAVGHLIFFSCSIMHQSSEELLSETDWDANAEMNPKYFGAGWTKIYIEKMCEFYSRLGRTKHTAIRHSNIYGPHDKFDLDRSHVFGATITKVLTAHDRVTIWGDGEETRDLLHVRDLVAFVARAIDLQTSPFELVNVASGTSISIRNLVAEIIAASGREVHVDYDVSAPSVKSSIALDIAKAAAGFGWEPSISLQAGIAETISWWRANH